jgi:osmotically inducible protein OsmC
VDIEVRGEVSANDEEFQSAVQQAEQICPVSNALRNNVEIRVNASLGR